MLWVLPGLILLLMTGCEEEQKEELSANLSSQIVLDEKGAQMVCSVDKDYKEQGYVESSKFVIYADENGVVTKLVSQQIISSNDKEALRNTLNNTEKNADIVSQYGGYESSAKITGNKLIVDTTIDYTKFNLEELSQDNEDIQVFLNDNYQYTLTTMKQMYLSVGVDECHEI